MSAPNSFSTNTRIKSAEVNANFNYLTNMSAFRAYRAGTQSINDITYTDVLFTTENYDLLGEYDNVTGIFTATNTGLYHIGASILWASNAWANGELCVLRIWYNDGADVGIDRWEHNVADTNLMMNRVSTDLQMNAGDTIRIEAYQSSGGALNITGGTNYTKFFMHRIIY